MNRLSLQGPYRRGQVVTAGSGVVLSRPAAAIWANTAGNAVVRLAGAPDDDVTITFSAAIGSPLCPVEVIEVRATSTATIVLLFPGDE